MDEFKNKLDAFKILKEKKKGIKISVHFSYYETANNCLNGVMTIYLGRTAGVGRLFGKGNFSLQQILDVSPQFEIKYKGKNKPKNESTNSLIFELYFKKRHSMIYKIIKDRNAKMEEKEKFGLDADFYPSEENEDDEYGEDEDDGEYDDE